MKKYFALLLALVMVLSLVACGGEPTPEEVDPSAPVGDDATDPDYDQLVALTQTLIGVEDSMTSLGSLRDGLLDGSVTEEQALTAYNTVNEQAAAVYTTVQAAQWQGDTYANEVDLLNQAAEAMALYADTSYQAMVNNDAAMLEEAVAMQDNYMTQMDALLAALGV